MSMTPTFVHSLSLSPPLCYSLHSKVLKMNLKGYWIQLVVSRSVYMYYVRTVRDREEPQTLSNVNR